MELIIVVDKWCSDWELGICMVGVKDGEILDFGFVSVCIWFCLLWS